MRPCLLCGKEELSTARWALGYKTCLKCGEEVSKEARKSWTILTPHKQGAMFFTAESAFGMAKGINNKGGLIK